MCIPSFAGQTALHPVHPAAVARKQPDNTGDGAWPCLMALYLPNSHTTGFYLRTVLR